MKIVLLACLVLVSGCASTTPYVEYTHISSIPNGFPFSGLPETQVDTVSGGLRYRHSGGLYVDAALAVQTGASELEGRPPFGHVSIGYEFGPLGSTSK